jgi:hypothetical protein
MKRVRIVAAGFVLATLMGAPAASAFDGLGDGGAGGTDSFLETKFKVPKELPKPRPGYEWVYVVDVPAVCELRGPFTNSQTGLTEYTVECTPESGHWEQRRRRG